MKDMIYHIKDIKLLFFLCWMTIGATAQNIVLPIQHEHKNLYENKIHQMDSNFHTAVQPYVNKSIFNISEKSLDDLRIDNKYTNGSFLNYILNEELFQVEEKGDFNITGKPIAGLYAGWASDTSYAMVLRGGRLEGSIGKKVYYSTDIYWGNAITPNYIVNRNESTSTFIGNGARRTFIGSTGQQESSLNATGHITYQANKYFNFQLGHGKVFIGDGYRSLLLSDNSTFYPYARLTTKFWNIEYTNLYTSMIDVQSGITNQGTLPRKYITSHYLSWNITPRLNIGAFETVIYQDSANTRGFDLYYLNPVIFYRPIEFEIGSDAGNALIGFTAKFKATNDLHFYGQFIFDEWSGSRNDAGDGCWCNKYGWQLGFKSFNTFIPNLTVQSEVNSVTFYTYSHRIPLQNYANSNLALAHPLGANFIESMTLLRYQNKRWTGKAQFMYALQGLDSLGTHWGADINRPSRDHEQDYGNKLLQGVKTNINYADVSVGYLVNPRMNLQFEAGYRYRGFTPEVEIGNLQQSVDAYFYLAFKTNFTNWYYDY